MRGSFSSRVMFVNTVRSLTLVLWQMKTMARNSLQYPFIAGGSLWKDARGFVPVAQCAQYVAVMKLSSTDCRKYLEGSEKAKLQWNLEEDFRAFERAF